MKFYSNLSEVNNNTCTKKYINEPKDEVHNSL